jgi:hypothetical protein
MSHRKDFKLIPRKGLEPCPNCGNSNVEFVEVADIDNQAGIAVECLDCCTRGQCAWTDGEKPNISEGIALQFWNQMSLNLRDYPRIVEALKVIDSEVSKILRGK